MLGLVADLAALFHPAGLQDLETPPDQPDPHRPWGPEARAGLHRLAAPCCRRSGRRVTSIATPWSALLATRASLFFPRKSRPKIPAKKIKVDRLAQGKGSVSPPHWRSRSALSKLRANNAGRRWINGQTKMTAKKFVAFSALALSCIAVVLNVSAVRGQEYPTRW